MNKKYKIEDKKAGKVKITLTQESETIVTVSQLEQSIIIHTNQINALHKKIEHIKSIKSDCETSLAEAKKLLK